MIQPGTENGRAVFRSKDLTERRRVEETAIYVLSIVTTRHIERIRPHVAIINFAVVAYLLDDLNHKVILQAQAHTQITFSTEQVADDRVFGSLGHFLDIFRGN